MDSDFSYEPSIPAVNPYAAPVADIGIMTPEVTELEAIRRQYLKHEASVKSIATLYLIPALLSIVWGVVAFGMSLATNDITMLPSGIILLVLGALALWTALQIRKLRRWSVIPVGILSGIGLIWFPIGTLINAYILWLVFCAKGKYVMSKEYQQVIAATPNIKYRTSNVVIGCFLVLCLLLGLGVFPFFFGG